MHSDGGRPSGGPRQPLPPGCGGTSKTQEQPGQDEIGAVVPRLAAAVEPIGEYQGSGLAEATYLVRNAVGQIVHLSRLLYLVVSAIDGLPPGQRDRRAGHGRPSAVR